MRGRAGAARHKQGVLHLKGALAMSTGGGARRQAGGKNTIEQYGYQGTVWLGSEGQVGRESNAVQQGAEGKPASNAFQGLETGKARGNQPADPYSWPEPAGAPSRLCSWTPS